MNAHAAINSRDTPEIWKPVPGVPYEASSYGRIRRFGRSPQKGRVHTNGYIRASISANGSVFDGYAHRLVCLAFHGEPKEIGHHVDHINGDRADNRPQNLRWLSPQANRALRTFPRGAQNALSKLCEADVRKIKKLPFARGQDRRLALQLNVSRETVRDVRLGKVWGHVQ